MSGLDLTRRRRAHVVGVGGAGMSAIATVLAAMGHDVTGSDLRDSSYLERLKTAGVGVEIGHESAHVGDAEVLVISTAVPDTNAELAEARRRGIPVHSRAEALAAITSLRRTVAVAGTHGKTTTSSMLALALVEAGLRPSFIIGGEVNEVGTNAVWDAGEWLVVEADESDGTFLHLEPELAVVTNVEPDHLDFYESFPALESAFGSFLGRSTAPPVLSADDAIAGSLAGRLDRATTFGFSDGSTFRLSDFDGSRSQQSFELSGPSGSLGRFRLPAPGRHNALNAAAATAAALHVGAGVEDVRHALARFAGVARRFEYRGDANGVTFVDDYAHLPGEISATLDAAGDGGWGRIVCVFQPHRYTRVQSLWRDFADAFVGADLLLVTSIYAAGEAPRPGISGKRVLDVVLEAHPGTPAAYLPTREELVSFLRGELRPGDLCLTLGAGDLTSLPDELIGEPV